MTADISNDHYILLLVTHDTALDGAIQGMLADSKPVSGWVHPVRSIDACIEALSTRPFDLVLLDLSLPDMPGPEGLKTLRASSHHPPVIVFDETHNDT
ncbi:MAG: response regulator, partial [Desulfatitalea sp.]|nr:response regulator [Desulfatitalea sp.]NNK00087.1 response regulator [Desulfatitalea sp.]